MLKTTETNCLIVPEAGSPPPRYGQRQALSEAVGGPSCLSQPLVFCWQSGLLACSCISPITAFIVTWLLPVCLSLHGHSLTKTPVILG